MTRPALTVRLFCLSAVLAASCGGSPTEPSGGSGAVTDLQVTGAGLVETGNTIQLNAEAFYSDGSARDVTSEASWSSASPSIATVDSTGRVTGLVTWQVLISASFGGETDVRPLIVRGAQSVYRLELQRIECLGDCEDITQGNGDFSYLVLLRSEVGLETLAGTAGYPSADLVIRLGTGDSYTLDAPKIFYVRDEAGSSMELTFRATEWDTGLSGDFPDSRMEDRGATAVYSYNGQSNWIPQGANYITLGSSDACRIRLHYLITQ
jgi:hypothetical protein